MCELERGAVGLSCCMWFLAGRAQISCSAQKKGVAPFSVGRKSIQMIPCWSENSLENKGYPFLDSDLQLLVSRPRPRAVPLPLPKPYTV